MNKEGDLIGGGQKERESLAPYPVPIAGQVHNHTPTTPQGSPVPFSKIEFINISGRPDLLLWNLVLAGVRTHT